MSANSRYTRHILLHITALTLLLLSLPGVTAVYGPWNAKILTGGVGFEQPSPKQAQALSKNASWSLYGWVRAGSAASARTLIAGVGKPTGNARYFFTKNNRLGFWFGAGRALLTSRKLPPRAWHFIAAVKQHGRLSLYLDGRQIGTSATRPVEVAPRLILGPQSQSWPNAAHFGGKIAGFSLQDGVLSGKQLAALAKHKPNSLTRFAEASQHWPVQTHQMGGMQTAQAPGHFAPE